jgi:hypothetical protein
MSLYLCNFKISCVAIEQGPHGEQLRKKPVTLLMDRETTEGHEGALRINQPNAEFAPSPEMELWPGDPAHAMMEDLISFMEKWCSVQNPFD